MGFKIQSVNSIYHGAIFLYHMSEVAQCLIHQMIGERNLLLSSEEMDVTLSPIYLHIVCIVGRIGSGIPSIDKFVRDH
jgi:hypothetical protein